MFGDGTGPLWTIQDNLTLAAAGGTGTTTLSCSLDLSTAKLPPPPGHTWLVYVKAVGISDAQRNQRRATGNAAALSQAF
jgi:hypothetical protein